MPILVYAILIPNLAKKLPTRPESDVKDVSGNVPPARIISYGKETLYIPYIEHFEDLDKSERMAKYSSLDIMKKIISLIEGR